MPGSAPSPPRDDGVRNLTADDAMVALEAKLLSKYSSLRKAFMTLHPGHGDHPSLSRAEFKTFLAHTGLELEPVEFAKLWKRFDASGDGRLDYNEVQKHFGKIISPPMEGLKMARPPSPLLTPRAHKAVATSLKHKLGDVEGAFRAYDVHGVGAITTAEYLGALRRMALKLDDKAAIGLLHRYKAPGGEDHLVTLPEFKAVIAHFADASGGGAGGGGGGGPGGHGHAHGQHSPPGGLVADAEEREAAIADAKAAALAAAGGADAAEAGARLFAAFAAADPHGRTEVDFETAKAVFASLGVPLGAKAHAAVMARFDPEAVGAFSYAAFAAAASGGAFVPPTPHARDAERAWKGLHSLEDAGLRPEANPLSGRPYELDALMIKVSPRVGLSEAETRMIFALVGRKDAFAAALAAEAAREGRSDGFITVDAVSAALAVLGVSSTEALRSQLLSRYPKDATGKRVSYPDLLRRLTPLVTINDVMLKKLMLERDPAAERSAAHDAEAAAAAAAFSAFSATAAAASGGAPPGASSAAPAPAPGSNEPYNPAAMQPLPPAAPAPAVGPADAGGAGAALAVTGSGARGGARGGPGAGASSRRAPPAGAAPAGDGGGDEAGSVATAAMDLAPIASKMRRVLGPAWSATMADALRANAKAGAAVPGTALVAGSVLRDVLAGKGVALTSKELRALSVRYHGAGPAATRAADGVIDVDALTATLARVPAQHAGGGAAPRGAAAQASPAKSTGGRGGGASAVVSTGIARGIF